MGSLRGSSASASTFAKVTADACEGLVCNRFSKTFIFATGLSFSGIDSSAVGTGVSSARVDV